MRRAKKSATQYSRVNRQQRDYSSVFLLFLLAGLIVFWFRDVIFYNKIFCFGDLPRYFYPLRRFGAETIKSGTVPLWNPYLYCGFPFLAILQSAVFYPLSVIGYILPSFDTAFNYFIVSHFFLGGIFVFFLMRHWGLRPISGFVSALTFTFSGYLCSVVHMNTSLSSVVWIPIIMLFFDKALRTFRLSYLLLTGIFLGIQFLGGEPTIVYGTVWLLFFYCLTRFSPAAGWKRNLQELSRSILFLAGVAVFAAALTLVQGLPFVELLRRSHRAAGSGFEQLSTWSLPPVELINFFIPFSLGNITLPGGYWGPQKWLASNYVGIFSLILAGVGAAFRPHRKSTFLTFVLLGSLVLALGKYTHLYRMLYHWVPGFNYIRYPVKYLFLTTFALAVLAGFGYEKIAREAGSTGAAHRLGRSLLWLNLGIGVILVITYLYRNEIFGRIIKHYFPGGIYDWQLERFSSIFITDVATFCRTMIFFTLGTFLIFLLLRKRIRPALVNILAPAIILVDLGSAHLGINTVTDRDLFHQETRTVKALKKDESYFRIFRSSAVSRINASVYGPDYGRGLLERKDTFTANTMMLYRFFDAYGYGSLIGSDLRRIVSAVNRHRPGESAAALSLLNVKYLAAQAPIEMEGFRALKKVPVAVGEVWISKNERCLPRAFLVKDAVVIKDREEILTHLFSGEFDPAHQVVLEEEPPVADSFLIKSDDGGREWAEIVDYQPHEIEIEVRLKKCGFLVLSEAYYPGWKVLVDGKIERLYRADYVLKAVRLTRGHHRVRFIYSPLSYRIGMWVSLMTVIGTVLLAGCRLRRRC